MRTTPLLILGLALCSAGMAGAQPAPPSGSGKPPVTTGPQTGPAAPASAGAAAFRPPPSIQFAIVPQRPVPPAK